MKMRWVVLCAGLGVLLTGCAALPRGSVIFSHTPLLPTGTIPAKVGLKVFEDRRPEEERRALKNIANLNEQLTSLFLEDLTHVKLFDSLELTEDPTRVDILLRGQIRSLVWRSKWYPITFIPYLNLVTLLGFPAGMNQGGAHILLEVVNAHTGQVIAHYEQSSGSSKTYSIYQANEYRVSGGEETREALRIIFDQFKHALWNDRQLLSTTKP